MQVRAEANLIWLCRAQPTINRINLPEVNIKICNLITFIITTFGNVPADLRSAGIEYKDLLIRLKYRCIIKVSNDKFNAKFALKV